MLRIVQIRITDYWFHAVNAPRNWMERHPALMSMLGAAVIFGVYGLLNPGVGTGVINNSPYIFLIGLTARLVVREKQKPVRRRAEAQRAAEEAQRQAAWEPWFAQQPQWKRELVLANRQLEAQQDLARRAFLTAAMYHNQSMYNNQK